MNKDVIPRNKYMDFLIRNKDLQIIKVITGEVDFVAVNDNGNEYYQVSETTLESSTLVRELKPLQSIADQYPKFLLTLDEITPEADYNGITRQRCPPLL